MDAEYRIEFFDDTDQSAIDVIGPGIRRFNEQMAGGSRHQPLCFVLRAPDESIVGGLIGAIHWDWLHVDLLWLREDLRGHGHGHRLLAMAEDEARRRGAKNAYLDTFSFQAPDFYREHGYQVFGELRDFPAGHQRYFLTKQL